MDETIERTVASVEAKLMGNLKPGAIKRNPQGHDYVDGFYVKTQLNMIFGPLGWSKHTSELVEVCRYQAISKRQVEMWHVMCRATVTVTVIVEGVAVSKTDTGTGEGIKTDRNDAAEGAIKSAETDGLKRAAAMLGNPLGLALYDKEREFVGDPEPEQKADTKKPDRRAVDFSKLESLEIARTIVALYNGAQSVQMARGASAMRDKARDYLDDDGHRAIEAARIVAGRRLKSARGQD